MNASPTFTGHPALVRDGDLHCHGVPRPAPRPAPAQVPEHELLADEEDGDEGGDGHQHQHHQLPAQTRAGRGHPVVSLWLLVASLWLLVATLAHGDHHALLSQQLWPAVLLLQHRCLGWFETDFTEDLRDMRHEGKAGKLGHFSSLSLSPLYRKGCNVCCVGNSRKMWLISALWQVKYFN